MNRRNFLKTIGASASALTLAGCATTQTPVHTEISAAAQVTDVQHNDDGSVTATVEVVSDDPEGGTVGLHIHYFHGDECSSVNVYHTHMPSVYVPSGESVEIRDTYKHGKRVGCVSAHVHE